MWVERRSVSESAGVFIKGIMSWRSLYDASLLVHTSALIC